MHLQGIVWSCFTSFGFLLANVCTPWRERSKVLVWVSGNAVRLVQQARARLVQPQVQQKQSPAQACLPPRKAWEVVGLTYCGRLLVMHAQPVVVAKLQLIEIDKWNQQCPKHSTRSCILDTGLLDHGSPCDQDGWPYFSNEHVCAEHEGHRLVPIAR